MAAYALLTALAFLLPARAFADVAATGMFDIVITPGIPNASFTGDIRFDSAARNVFGAQVNMATAVGDMTFDGNAVVDLVTERADFDLTADSDDEFTFDASGTATCDNTNCFDGRGNLAGRLTSIEDPDGVLPDGIYTFDGTAAINSSGQGLNGRFAINAFLPVSTPSGPSVQVMSTPQAFWDTVADTERTFDASALFDSVTGPGSTDFVAFSTFPNAFPTGINANSMVSVFVDVATTALFTGNVFVCLAYPDENDDDIVDGTPNNLSALRLRVLHAATDAAAFTDVTVGLPDGGLACGTVTTLGRFALGVGPAAGTTTTIVGASTTTSTTLANTSTTLLGASTTTSTIPTVSTTTLPPGATTTSTSVPTGETTTTSTTVSPGESTTTTSTSLPGASTTTTLAGASTTTSSTAPRRSTTTTVASGSTTTTLPVCTSALECLGVAIAGPICPGETVNPKLSTLILKKLAKAQTALLAARSANSAKKVARLVKKARKQVDKVTSKASAFVSKPKGAISAGCRDRIIAATALVTQQIDANKI